MSGSYSSRLRGGGVGSGLAATTLLLAKVVFASAAVAAAVSLGPVALPQVVSLGRVALTQIVSGADSLLLKLYLFVTVHVIIFVIYKLSGNKHSHAQQHKDPWAPTPHHPSTSLLTEELVLAAMKHKVEFPPAAVAARREEISVAPPVPRTQEAAIADPADEYRAPVSRPHEAAIADRVEEFRVPHIEPVASKVDEEVVSPGSCGGESCVTAESEEDAASSAVTASAYVAAADSSRSVAPLPSPAPVRKRAVVQLERAVVQLERAVVQRVISLPPAPPVSATDEYFDVAGNHSGGGGDDDDLDATWNAIMQKTRPSTAPALSSSSSPARRPPPPAPSPRLRAREPSVGAAEINKRSEDFIKKIYSSFGREQ